MASGTINLSKSKSSGAYIEGKIVWSATADNEANASKNISAKLYVRKGDPNVTLTVPTSGTWSYTLTVNGSKMSGSIQKSVLTDWVLIATKTITKISHDSDGAKKITISGSVKAPTGTSFEGHTTSGSKSVSFDTIPRATSFESLSCATNYFTGTLTYKYTPKSSSFYNRCNISLNLDGTYIAVKSIDLGQKSAAQQTATVTLATSELTTIYNELPNGTKGTLRFTFRTYSDSGYSSQIGDAVYREVELNIPNDASTQAVVSMSLSPVGSLPDAFAGVYIQGKTKVKATLSATGKFKASIKALTMKVDGIIYDSGDSYTSGYMNTAGVFTVYGYAKDSRGYTGQISQNITVIGYSKPRIMNVTAERCDSKGNKADDGTYLKIKAKRSYSPVTSNGVQKNFCQIRYRYKLSSAASYSSWETILAADNLSSDQVETAALLSGALSVDDSYMVQLQAVDDLGGTADTFITVPSDKVYWHRDGARNSFTFGGYVEEDNTFAIAAGIEFKVKSLTGNTVTVSDTGWIDLGIASTAVESTSYVGRNGPGCYYRVINGNHVYVAFNCACELAGENVQLNATAIPAKYRPARAAYAILPTAGRAVIRGFVNDAGLIKIGWLQSLTSGEETSPASVTWVDGYIDYWI